MLLRGSQDAVRDIMVIVVEMAAPHFMNFYQLRLVGRSGWRNVLSRIGMPSDMAGLDGAGDLGGEGRVHCEERG